MLTNRHPPKKNDFHKQYGPGMHHFACGNRGVEAEIIRSTMRGVWPSLPALLVASAAVCAAATVPVLLAPGVNPVALLVAAVVCGPCLAALAAVTNEIAFEGQSTTRSWWQAVRRRCSFGLQSALVPAVPAVLFLAAVEVWNATNNPLVWPSFVVTGMTTLVALLGLMAALPLGDAQPDLRGVRLWVVAVPIVAARPSRFIAVASAIGFVVWISTELSASLLLFLPAPAAIVAVTATWTSVAAVESVTPETSRR